MISNQEILTKSEELFTYMQQARRQLHQYPEVGMQEFRTAAYIREKLDEAGIPYRDKVGGTGIVSMIKGKEPGRCIALRADMDALTIQEKTGTDYASKLDGFMHACGHDAHVAILLGAGRILNEIKDQFNGTVKLFFQPAEEGPGGAKPMIDDGAMEDPHVDAAAAFHVSSGNKTGHIGIHKGVNHAAMQELDIIVTGKGGHAAYPHTTVDAVTVACAVVTALQTIVARKVDPLDSAVITIGTINGGYRRNIIADRIEMQGTIRYLKDETGDILRKNIEDICNNISASMGGSCQVIFGRSYPPVVNDGQLSQQFEDSLKDLLGADRLFPVEHPTMGAEDFAFFARMVPSVFMRLGSAGENKEFSEPHHNSRFDLDEKALITGCAGFVKLSLDFLK